LFTLIGMEERLPLAEAPRSPHLDRRTVEVGRRGVLEARAALRRSREAMAARRHADAA
jgi:hypothetical protein